MCCKKWFARTIRDRADRYIWLLLNDKIRLKDVPKSVRLYAPAASRIHTAAFRADRAFPIKRFEEDLQLVGFEIFCAKAANDTVLMEVLGRIEKRAKWSYEVLKKKGD